MPLLHFKNFKALIFNEKGEYLKSISIPKYNQKFKFLDKSFNFIQTSSYFQIKGLLYTTRYFFYNISNPNPLILDKKAEAIISPELYNVMLETEVAKKLNDTNKTGLLSLLNPKIIIGVIVVAIIGYYLLTGGLTP